MQKDCRNWAKACQTCQRSKVSRHTDSPVGDFTLPPTRFLHVRIDLSGLLPTSAGSTYFLTAVDRFTRWPEAIPIPNITTQAVTHALLTGWISRFGCPQIITTDQGRQFESQLFHSLAKLCGTQLSWTTAYHPAADGLVERFHRTLKAAIMCPADKNWTQELPLFLLGIRSSFKADLHASSAELVHGETLRILGKFLTQTAHPIEPALLITQLRQHMSRLGPVPATRNARPGTFVHKDLHTCTHVFLRQDATRLALEPPYSGLYQVISRKEKTLRLLVRGKPTTLSTDRVKPAYIFNEADFTHNISNPAVKTTPTIAPPTTPPATSSPHPATRTTRSGCHVYFSARFNT
jgi:cleavage and polyadenylation specificity factor subunit 1